MRTTKKYQIDKAGNITQLTRWDNQDIMNLLHYTYDGNQVTKVTDEGYYPVDYSCKRYMDLADEDVEMGYDDNGNLIYDLDRQIVAIRYNILNLPDTVQFANGNQIINYYDALGTRYKTSYRTRKVAATVPIGITLSATDNLSDYTMITHAMDKNIKYLAYGNDALTLDYVFISEGYIRYYNAWEHYRFYYIKDHLGNVRETYVNPAQGSKLCAQRMQYYPSGLPWNDNLYASEQPYKYNGKEFMEMHGYDEYDSEARWYYPALGRTTTIDPLAEKYYNISPYAWCGNNTIKFVDPTGDSIRLWVETTGVGHTWITTGEGNNLQVYSYGRYDDLNKDKTFLRSLSITGDGVLLKLGGDDATQYQKSKIAATHPISVVIPDISDQQMEAYFDKMFYESTELPSSENSKYYQNPNAHVIDTYNLLSNNCTTKAIEAINSLDSNFFKYNLFVNPTYGQEFMIYNLHITFIAPWTLYKFLNTR